ncbi:MAG: hypothetical protein KAT75_00685 [Dehalococcoidia bacterium]|nr:hypothetical protein [Dehalococcoidia bacterium]
MSRAIKVDDKVYDQLDVLKGKGETFSQVIEIILVARGMIFNMLGALETHLQYREWQQQRLQDLENKYKEEKVEVSNVLSSDT